MSDVSDREPDDTPWTRSGKVSARLHRDSALEVAVDGLTTQTKYYKPLLKEFFRKTFTAIRPRWGDFDVHIVMRYTGDPPHMDLDNLAKALLDSATGAAFHDDSQVARLLVERVSSDREGIWMKISAAPRPQPGPQPGPRLGPQSGVDR